MSKCCFGQFEKKSNQNQWYGTIMVLKQCQCWYNCTVWHHQSERREQTVQLQTRMWRVIPESEKVGKGTFNYTSRQSKYIFRTGLCFKSLALFKTIFFLSSMDWSWFTQCIGQTIETISMHSGFCPLYQCFAFALGS